MRFSELVSAIGCLDPTLVFRNGFKAAFRHTEHRAALALQRERDTPVSHLYKVLKTVEGIRCPPSHSIHNKTSMLIDKHTPLYFVDGGDDPGVLVKGTWFRDEVEFAILHEEYAIARSLLDHISEWVRRTERYDSNKKNADDMIVLRASAPDLGPTARYTVSWGTMKVINGWVTGQYTKETGNDKK